MFDPSSTTPPRPNPTRPTPQAVSSSGKACLLDIDVQGAEIVKRSSLNSRFVFIAPPSFEELERRLRSRGTETEDKIQARYRRGLARGYRGEA